ncbi:auxin-repressed 12.5 kDa protein-like isoform X1 [Macadamia integrifolia]|uniref:auxin-repressed 12.5 kDa protein-like isoform X1 n=1 Tax=Macadamia integrifolia TaxID=60698 RepID=UPI001C4FD571|nr:auxin-repressed 12.5 kDa protein-like isoform X1 [Macadamia integrifolia]
MVSVENFWDEVVAGPYPDQGTRKITTKPLNLKRYEEGEGSKSLLMPESPTTPATLATPSSARKENEWRSVFNPGSNLATKGIGAALFDKPQPNTPTVYDWLYSNDTRSKHR